MTGPGQGGAGPDPWRREESPLRAALNIGSVGLGWPGVPEGASCGAAGSGQGAAGEETPGWGEHQVSRDTPTLDWGVPQINKCEIYGRRKLHISREMTSSVELLKLIFPMLLLKLKERLFTGQ